jgi:hypothetical protein
VCLAAMWIGVGGLTVACNAQDDGAPADGVLQGKYEASGEGPIGTITFEDDGRYALDRSQCDAFENPDACVETGTFEVSDDGRQLVLLNERDGTRTTLPFEVRKSQPPAIEAAEPTVHANALVTPISRLARNLVVSEALMGEQPVQLISGGCDDFTVQMPAGVSAADVLSKLKKRALCNNGTLDERGRTFNVLGTQGHYSIDGNQVTIGITQTDKFCFLARGFFQGAITDPLSSACLADLKKMGI